MKQGLFFFLFLYSAVIFSHPSEIESLKVGSEWTVSKQGHDDHWVYFNFVHFNEGVFINKLYPEYKKQGPFGLLGPTGNQIVVFWTFPTEEHTQARGVMSSDEFLINFDLIK